MSQARTPRILLGVTGSIAAFKAPELVREFRNRGAEVVVVLTEAATRFVGALTFEAMTGNPVGTDLFDRRGAAALPHWIEGTDEARLPYHLAMAECADLLVVAPASASTIAKMVHGTADNLLTSSLLATTKPIVVAPAMNPHMWSAPATVDNVRTLRERGVHVIDPDVGKMAWRAESEGAGRFPDPPGLAERIWSVLETHRQLAGTKVVVTAGGTEEPVDAVRVLGNRSSGRMGVSLAEEARDRGAEVVLVAAGMSVPLPPGVRVVRARTAAAMRDAVHAETEDAAILLMAAAVADWRPTNPAAHKLKKSDGPPVISLELTDDILAGLGSARPGLFLVGFALETDDPIENGRKKLHEKNVDLLVVNDASEEGAGFDVPTNRVTLLTPDGATDELPLLPKRDVARHILDRVSELRPDS